jgi:hypothetical protein
MQLHLLLTPEIRKTMPPSVTITADWGNLLVIFPDKNHNPVHNLEGLHCFIDGPKDDIITWLKPFDGVPIGSGSPMLEQFTIKHIK